MSRDIPPPSPSRQEAELLARARNGDRDAFVQLIQPYQEKVYSAVMRLLGNPEDAAEVTQEAVLRTFWSLAGFHGRSNFYTWFYRIAVNLSYRRLVKRRREPVASPPSCADEEGESVCAAAQVPSQADSPREEAASRETVVLIRRALARLKPSDFEILVLREFENLSYEQLASQMKIPQGTVMSRLHRARMALARELANLGIGP